MKYECTILYTLWLNIENYLIYCVIKINESNKIIFGLRIIYTVIYVHILCAKIYFVFPTAY